MCGTNADTTTFPNNVIVNNVPIATVSGGSGGSALTVNKYGAEFSDFQISAVMIWDVGMSVAELKVISTQLNNYLLTGILW
jgi:hypothetical protein